MIYALDAYEQHRKGEVARLPDPQPMLWTDKYGLVPVLEIKRLESGLWAKISGHGYWLIFGWTKLEWSAHDIEPPTFDFRRYFDNR